MKSTRVILWLIVIAAVVILLVTTTINQKKVDAPSVMDSHAYTPVPAPVPITPCAPDCGSSAN